MYETRPENASQYYNGGVTAAVGLNQQVQIKEPGLCAKLEEAMKYANDLFAVLTDMEIKLRRGPEKPSNGADQTGPMGAIGAASDLCQKLANAVGFARTLNNLL